MKILKTRSITFPRDIYSGDILHLVFVCRAETIEICNII